MLRTRQLPLRKTDKDLGYRGGVGIRGGWGMGRVGYGGMGRVGYRGMGRVGYGGMRAGTVHPMGRGGWRR